MPPRGYPRLALAVLFGVAVLGSSGALAAGTDAPATTPQLLYERAESLYRQLDAVDPSGRSAAWGEVADVFHLVTERYPEDALAEEALWRVAEIRSLQAESGSTEAVERERHAYREFLDRYPLSSHAPEALLRLAILAEEHPGAESSAEVLYQRLLNDYPGTSQAEAGRTRLASLSAADAPEPSPGSERRQRSLGQPAGPTDGGSSAAATGVDQQALPSGSSGADPAAGNAVAAGESSAQVVAVRHYAAESHTRVVVEVDRPVEHDVGETQDPPRLFFDLLGASLPGSLDGTKSVDGELLVPGTGNVSQSSVERVRVAQNRPGVVRVVIDLEQPTRYSLFTLDNAFRIVVDIPGSGMADRLADARRPEKAKGNSVARQLRLGVRTIVIDPGHGGQDPGAISRSGVTEKELTLDLAKRLAAMFRSNQSYEVILTREDDRTLSLEERREFANEVGADLFVSVHINSSHNSKLSGFETYYLNLATDPTAAAVAARENSVARGRLSNLEDLLEQIVRNDHKIESSDLAEAVQDNLVSHVSKEYGDVRDLGVKEAPFYVLVGAEMPAILVEASFLSHAAAGKRLEKEVYRQRLAEALYIGIQSYVEGRRVAVYPSGYEP